MNLRAHVIKIWEKTSRQLPLGIWQRSFFLLACCCEPLYRIIFFINQSMRRLCRKAYQGPPIIAVGNLTVGGTGKTVMVSYLLRTLAPRRGAVVTRGYGRKTRDPMLLRPGQPVSVDIVGDEPWELFIEHAVPIAIAQRRWDALRLLDVVIQDLDFILVDDGYQQRGINAQLSILLLDARAPLGNGHCLPAGPLREKEYTRADIVLLTHANAVPFSEIANLTKRFAPIRDKKAIFPIYHRVIACVNARGEQLPMDALAGVRAVVFAGIGSFDGFLSTVRALGVDVVQAYQFDDHHWYQPHELSILYRAACVHPGVVLLTTAKDWPKISRLLELSKDGTVEVVKIITSIGFLFPADESRFIARVYHTCGW